MVARFRKRPTLSQLPRPLQADMRAFFSTEWLACQQTDDLLFQAGDPAANPPILHRKETFLQPTHPLHAKFSRLTRQEEQHGLLDDTATIGTRAGWEARLRQTGLALRGHRLVRQKPVQSK